VPTIDRRARIEMVGTLSLCPCYDCCGLICLARKRNLDAHLRQTGTTANHF